MKSDLQENYTSNPRTSRFIEKENMEKQKYPHSDYHSLSTEEDSIIFSFFNLKNTATWKLKGLEPINFEKLIVRQSNNEGDNNTSYLKLKKIDNSFIFTIKVKKDKIKIGKSATLKFELLLFTKEEENSPDNILPFDISINNFMKMTGIMLFLVDNELKWNIITDSTEKSDYSQREKFLNCVKIDRSNFSVVFEEIDRLKNLSRNLVFQLSFLMSLLEDCNFEEEKNFDSYDSAIDLADEFFVKLINLLTDEFSQARNNSDPQYFIEKSSNMIDYYKNSTLLQIINLKKNFIDAFLLLFDQPFLVEMKKFFSFNELLEKIKKLDKSDNYFQSLNRCLDEIKKNYSSLFAKKFFLKRPRDEKEIGKIQKFISELKEEALKNFNNKMKSNPKNVMKIKRIIKHLHLFSTSISSLIGLNVFNFFDELNFQNFLSKQHSLIELKFRIYAINFNMRSVFFKDQSYIIKRNFIVLVNGENPNYETESAVVKAAKNKLVELFNKLDEGDDLFNYLSFLNSDLKINEREEFIYYFNDKNNFDFIKSLLKEESVFENYVLYEYEIISDPIDGVYSDQTKQDITQEMNKKVAFTNNFDLLEVCCINKKLMNEECDTNLKKEKCFLYTLHEIVHLMLYKKIKNFNVREYKSPLIEELTYRLNQQSKDSGDMLEFMMAENLINEFIADDCKYTESFYNELNKIDIYKKDLKGFISVLKNRANFLIGDDNLPHEFERKHNRIIRSTIFKRSRYNLNELIDSREELYEESKISDKRESSNDESNLTEEKSFTMNLKRNYSLDNLINKSRSLSSDSIIEEAKSFEISLGSLKSDDFNNSGEFNFKGLAKSSNKNKKTINETFKLEQISLSEINQNRQRNIQDKQDKLNKYKIIPSKGIKEEVNREKNIKLTKEVKKEKSTGVREDQSLTYFIQLFEEFYDLRISEYFHSSLKTIILKIFYKSGLRLKNNYNREELFCSIYLNIKKILRRIKTKHPRYKRVADHPKIIYNVFSIIKKIYLNSQKIDEGNNIDKTRIEN